MVFLEIQNVQIRMVFINPVTNYYAFQIGSKISRKIEVQLLYVNVLAKAHLVLTKTQFNFIAAVYRHTQYVSIPSVSSVKC